MDKRTLIFVVLLAGTLFGVNFIFNKGKTQPPTQSVQKTQEASAQNVRTPSLPTASSNVEISSKEEQFYVLENNYQQLVFSNVGGALSEINLPLRSKENAQSEIRSIDFDRQMEKNYPENDHFPAFAYTIADPQGNGPVQVQEGKIGGYYPLLRRPIFERRKLQNVRINPQFYAFNTLSDDPNTGKVLYTVKRLEKDLIEFEGVEGQRRITKTYSFPRGIDAPYTFDLNIKIDGDTRGLWLTTGVPEVELISGSFTPNLKYRTGFNKKVQVEQIDLPKTSNFLRSVQPDWISNSNGFLGLIVNPLTEMGGGFSSALVPGTLLPTRLSLIDAHYNLYPAEKYPGYELQLPLPVSNQTTHIRVFAGPFASDILKKVDAAYSDPKTGYNPDYTASQSFHGWFSFISEPFAKFLFILMKAFYTFTHSWGLSIILLTVALRVMLYPLNAWSIKSTARMQQIAPKVAAIQERYKKEPKKGQIEVMNLYKEHRINPITGCFPILIQMPFLIGMFDLLKSTFELRGVPFIPGWINNLTAPDVVFSWNYPIIFFGTDFHLLPIILGAVMYFQQKMSSPLPKDKSQWTDQQKQQRMMGNIMTLVFTVMFYHFPSGLNIYWLSSMLLGILQQWWMTRRLRPITK